VKQYERLIEGSIGPFVITGQCWSMKNAKTAWRGKNKVAAQFELDMWKQIPMQYRNLRMGGRMTKREDPVLLWSSITVWYPSWRQDLDVSICYDVLQLAGVVANDRWIRSKTENGFVDRENPRIEIMIGFLRS